MGFVKSNLWHEIKEWVPYNDVRNMFLPIFLWWKKKILCSLGYFDDFNSWIIEVGFLMLENVYLIDDKNSLIIDWRQQQ